MKPIRHRLQTTFVVGLEHWIVVQPVRGGWQVLEIAEHASHTDSTHAHRRDAEAVAEAIAVVRSFNTVTAEDQPMTNTDTNSAGTRNGYLDEDLPRDRHSLTCPIWQSDDPDDKCDCGGDVFQAGVQHKLDRFESYGRAS